MLLTPLYLASTLDTAKLLKFSQGSLSPAAPLNYLRSKRRATESLLPLKINICRIELSDSGRKGRWNVSKHLSPSLARSFSQAPAEKPQKVK